MQEKEQSAGIIITEGQDESQKAFPIFLCAQVFICVFTSKKSYIQARHLRTEQVNPSVSV